MDLLGPPNLKTIWCTSSSKLLMVWILMKDIIINFLWNFENDWTWFNIKNIFSILWAHKWSKIASLACQGGDLTKVQLGFDYNYSHSKVKFNVNWIDNIIIQRISLFNTNIFCLGRSNDILFLNNIFMTFFKDGKKCYQRCPIYTFMW